MPLRRQMILWIAGPTLLIYVIILGVTAINQYRQSKQEVELAMTRLAASYCESFDGRLREVARIADTTAGVMGTGITVDDDAVYKLLENDVNESPLVYGSCLAFEPGTRRPGDELFGPYVHRTPDGLRRMNIDQSVYDWYRDPEYTWYSRPRDLDRAVWSDPYFDEGAGNILMSTYSAPFRSGSGFGGVCTVDIDLPRLRDTVGAEIEESLDFVILAADGRYIYHPDPSRIMAKTALEYVEPAQREGLQPVLQQMVVGQPGGAWLDGWENDEPVGVFFAPISSSGWVFVSRVPTEQVLGQVYRRTLSNGLSLVTALALIAGCIYYVAGRMAAPIAALEQGVMEVSHGDLAAHVDESASTDEVRNLAKSFNRMTADLRANLDRLAAEQSARERMERDLDIARQIQQGLLPAAKPDLPGYDIAGWSRPADKTGGDYFDWQPIDDGRLLVSLADVTGHGIGPALVAAVCRAYARAASKEEDLGLFIDQLNDLLIDDLPEGRFITFVGTLIDATSHQVQMISAGHGPMFRCVHASGTLVESNADGVPLGLIPQNEYGRAARFALDPGDLLLLITDGLFEWPNAAGEGFGLERLRKAIASLGPLSSEQTIQTLYEVVQRFTGGYPQEDDVTIVAIRRLPAGECEP